jgi:hypothetical protein
MKRDSEKTRAWLNAPRKPLARTKMRKIGAKKAKADREMRGPRLNFRIEMKCCALCRILFAPENLDIHEIAGGGNRFRSFRDRFTWLALCRSCHNEVQDWTKNDQYVLKVLSDKEFFNRDKLNLYFGSGERYSEADIVIAAYRLGRRHESDGSLI